MNEVVGVFMTGAGLAVVYGFVRVGRWIEGQRRRVRK